MSDFYQDGTISTLHDFGTKSTKDLEKELLKFSKERKMELILPCLYSELKGDAHPRHRAAASTLRNLATAPKSSQGSFSRVPPPTAVAGGLRLRAFGRAAAGFGLRFDGFIFLGRAGGASCCTCGAGAGASLASRLRRRARRSEAIPLMRFGSSPRRNRSCVSLGRGLFLGALLR